MNPLELSGERFRHLAADVAETTAEYLSTLHQRRVFPLTSGSDTERLFAQEEAAPEKGLGETALDALSDVLFTAAPRTDASSGTCWVRPNRSPPWAISSPPC